MRITDTQLGQVHVYPSESKGRLAILEMRPEHALNAWRLLREDAGERWDPVVKRSPLAGALLRQALGEDMLFAEDQSESPLFLEDTVAGQDVLLERCYDGLMAIDRLMQETPIHVIAQARIIARYVNPKESNT